MIELGGNLSVLFHVREDNVGNSVKQLCFLGCSSPTCE